MKKQGLEKAKNRLAAARSAFEQVKLAGADYDRFTQQWYLFLVAGKSIFEILRQSAGGTSNETWAAQKHDERVADPLLTYMWEARNSDEHGVAPISRKEEGATHVGVNRPGASRAFRFVLQNGRSEVTSLDGLPVAIEHAPEHIRLVPVRDRKNNVVPLPISHRGKPLAGYSPEVFGELWLAYLNELIREAEALT